jgi:murein DD-endopeptidase MepM/ murein hydrolase activator NlpD
MPLLEAPVSFIYENSTSTTPVDLSSSILSLINSAQTINNSDQAASTTGNAPKIASPSLNSGQNAGATVTNASTTIAITVYKVQSGDTLTGIAKKFGISLNTLLQTNQLKSSSTLKIGESLNILPISGVYYKVKEGDNLGSLASTYDTTVAQIESANGLTSSSIGVGQYLIIPTAATNPSSKAQVSKGTTKSNSPSLISKVTNATLGVKVAHADTADDSMKASVLAYYVRPVSGGVMSQGIHLRNAVDLATTCGAPIYASAAGTVSVVENDDGWNGGYGNYVEIDHGNGSQTLYAHMTDAKVWAGESVTQGQEIGTIGETGDATGCHVHFEIRNEPGNLPNPFDASAFEAA